MSTEHLKQQVLSLSLLDRVSLAQALWQSIGAGSPDTDEQAAVREAIDRDQEMSSGAVAVRTHDQVMHSARRIVKCD